MTRSWSAPPKHHESFDSLQGLLANAFAQTLKITLAAPETKARLMDTSTDQPTTAENDHPPSRIEIQSEPTKSNELLARDGSHNGFDDDGKDEASRLRALATDVRDQDDLERDVGRQADQLLTEQADQRDQKRLEKTQAEKDRLQSQIRKLREKLTRPAGSATTVRIQAEISHLEGSIVTLDDDMKQIQERIDERHRSPPEGGEPLLEESVNRRLPNESQREFLIRTGKITPFSKIPGRSLNRSESTLQDVLFDAEAGEDASEDEELHEHEPELQEKLSHRNLVQPGFLDDDASEMSSMGPATPERPFKRRRRIKSRANEPVQEIGSRERSPVVRIKDEDTLSEDEGSDAFMPGMDDREMAALGDSEHDSEEGLDDESLFPDTKPRSRKHGDARTKSTRDTAVKREDLARLDDGNETQFQRRLSDWISRRSIARRRAKARQAPSSHTDDWIAQEGIDDAVNVDDEGEMSADHEWHLPHPAAPDTVFDGGYRIPGDIFPSLFNYQKTGVQWLWELFSQQVGGIVGDEMGLGKTIQIISFLAGLHYSKKLTRPVIIVAPATVMKQWVNEFHTWWPPFRVSILHSSGSGMIEIGRESQREEELLSALPGAAHKKPLTKAHKAAKQIVDRVVSDGHVLVTTYTGLQSYAELLIPVDWEYAVLDEGHKIRNPNTAITIYCKELRTSNRIILSGTPMQNNLVELWSLFDFVFPMRLGTLVNFRQQFEIPIKQGGYANASNLQVQTAMKCAETLKDTISPYLLQRFKVDVASDLPRKSEKVLFCKLTKSQRQAYETFLGSGELQAIIDGKRQVLYGVDILRKICNHPDLENHKVLSVKPGYNYGSAAKSGKMQVVKELLQLSKQQGHKMLLFAQHRIMLDILESFVKSLTGFRYCRMDGKTPIHHRQGLVDDFNNNADINVFLLTTKVGGLGINLTGANRVIIYDPDWNPSTDIQARERAWRLGQKREVMIYRLMTAGTIEEKIYHRQLFKTFLTNKILRDPKQRQTFQMKDLHDLFTLGGADELSTETNGLFKGTEVQFSSDSAAAAAVNDDQKPRANQNAVATEAGDEDASKIPSIPGIASMERYRGEDAEDQKESAGNGTNSEARVMEGIFARAGVHSALEHDQIINGKRIITADPKIIEAEAKKVAAEAAKELKKAGEMARTVPVGTPTWTGEYGSAGRPDEQVPRRGLGRGRGGPSSSSILAGLQNRQATNAPINSSRSSTPAHGVPRNGTPGPRGVDFMKMIRDYLITHGGMAHTQMLIDHFNRFCNTAQKTKEFQAMLKELAILEKGSRGRGRWILKDEYKAR